MEEKNEKDKILIHQNDYKLMLIIFCVKRFRFLCQSTNLKLN